MCSDSYRRELLRVANRDRRDAQDVSDLLSYAELIYSMPATLRDGEPYPEPSELYDLWKESFDEEP